MFEIAPDNYDAFEENERELERYRRLNKKLKLEEDTSDEEYWNEANRAI